jgi:hypothetical protein
MDAAGGNGGGSAPPAELSTLRVLDPAPELLHGDHKPAVLGRSLLDHWVAIACSGHPA